MRSIDDISDALGSVFLQWRESAVGFVFSHHFSFDETLNKRKSVQKAKEEGKNRKKKTKTTEEEVKKSIQRRKSGFFEGFVLIIKKVCTNNTTNTTEKQRLYILFEKRDLSL